MESASTGGSSRAVLIDLQKGSTSGIFFFEGRRRVEDWIETMGSSEKGVVTRLAEEGGSTGATSFSHPYREGQ